MSKWSNLIHFVNRLEKKKLNAHLIYTDEENIWKHATPIYDKNYHQTRKNTTSLTCNKISTKILE